MNKYIAISLMSLAAAFSSCEKIIDLELDTTSAKIVIQGNIYNQEGPFAVKISKTADFDESSIYPPVSGASVIISDNHGTVDTLAETTAGTYISSTLQGISGYTYTLTVIAESSTYTASSTMPAPVGVDSIYVEKRIFGNEKQVTIDFHDPVDIENYYRIIQFKNNGQLKNISGVIGDELYKGKKMSFSVQSRQSDSDEELKSGDNIMVWLETIDKVVYEYFRTAESGGLDSATPANPVSNISNGALGYFNACSVTTKSIVVP